MKKLALGLPLLFLLAACGGGASGSTKTNDPLVTNGAKLYKAKACISCHTVDGAELVGPTWKGLYESTVQLDDGSVVTADEDYLRESMMDPSAKTVRGFPKGLMETVIKPGALSAEEVDALVAYIKSVG